MSTPELGGPGQRLCPSCARFGPESATTCRHCGYNFETGAPPSWGGTPILADQPESAPPTFPQPQTRRRWPARLLVIGVLMAIIGASFLPVLSLFDSATQLIEDIPGEIDVDIPDVTIPEIDVDDPFGEDAGSYGKCRARILRHMRKLLANDGNGSRPLNELFIEASEQLGVGTFEYRTMVSVFSDNQGTALIEGTKPALRGAERDTARACRAHYGGN